MAERGQHVDRLLRVRRVLPMLERT
jgi:hypothetical protein